MPQLRPKNREKTPEFFIHRSDSFRLNPKKSQKIFKWGAAVGHADAADGGKNRRWGGAKYA